MEEKNSLTLLSAFPPSSKEDWLKQLEKEIKGKAVADLDWEIEPGWKSAPMYHSSDMVAHLQQSRKLPVQRSGRTGKWEIIQPIDLKDAKKAVQIWEEAQNNGADGFLIHMHDANEAETIFRQLLDKTDISNKRIYLSRPRNTVLPVTDMLISLAGKQLKPRQLKGAIFHNPFAHIAKQKSLLDATHILSCESGVKQTHASPDFRTIGIDMRFVQEAGGSISQQLAFALSVCVDYFDFFDKSNAHLTHHEITSNISFCLPVGSLFFPEIAKFRAFRMLLARLWEVMNIENADPLEIPIFVRNGKWPLSHYDSHTNLLRLTTAAMAAVIGGANSLSLGTFDQTRQTDPLLSTRLSRNIQHILRHESHLDFVQDPGGGAYYIEMMTHQLAEASWKLFQQIETAGGFTTAMEQGLISEMLKSNLQRELRNHATGKNQMVGISLSANPEETLSPDQIKKEGGKAGIYESVRLKVDEFGRKNGKRLQAVLVGFGESRMQQARIQFSQDLLASGGIIPIIANWNELESVAETIRPELVVLCAADSAYEEQGASVLDLIHTLFPDSAIILAGRPENWQGMGVDDVIYKGMNAPEFLQKWLNRMNEPKKPTKN